MTSKWEVVDGAPHMWDLAYWEDTVTKSESCTVGYECPCGEYVHVEAVNTPTSCDKCGRIYRVEIERRLVCYTPLAIKYPKPATHGDGLEAKQPDDR